MRALDGVAVVALGTAPDGPWRVAVSADPWTHRKNLQAGRPEPLLAGALIWLSNAAFADRVAARVGISFARIGNDQRMPAPWFVLGARDVQQALESAARAERVECFTAQAWAARAEARRMAGGG